MLAHRYYVTFQDLKGVMIEVMKDTLKSKFSTEVEAAWNKTIDVLFLKIFEGIERTASFQWTIF